MFETLLVLTVAFGGSLLYSFYAVATSANVESEVSLSGAAGLIYGVLGQITALALLAYVMYRRGVSLAAIGLSFSWKDVPRSIGLALVAGVAYWLWECGIYYGSYFAGLRLPTGGPHNIGFLLASSNPTATALLLFYVLINPFKEELIVRAFLMSEVRWLSGRMGLAVVMSVVLQCCYHLYQGVFYAASYVALFLTFSLYYARTGRIFPVVLAHLYFDLLAVLH